MEQEGWGGGVQGWAPRPAILHKPLRASSAKLVAANSHCILESEVQKGTRRGGTGHAWSQ
eukprot:1610114-Rhodomonas_salina.1